MYSTLITTGVANELKLKSNSAPKKLGDSCCGGIPGSPRRVAPVPLLAGGLLPGGLRLAVAPGLRGPAAG